ncbi:MAG: hypothetical protein KJ607_13705, partial [Bacteroidetes bacterium]|nr:hypothetical protein [Bacteroidota bacterium]
GSMGWKVTTITAGCTLDETYNVVLIDSDTIINIYLPSATICKHRVYTIKLINIGAKGSRIYPAGTERIDGKPWSPFETEMDFVKIISDGSNWYKIGTNF